MGRWVERPVNGRSDLICGRRVERMGGNLGAAGEPFPPGTLAAAAIDVAARRLKLWLYSPQQGDIVREWSLNDIREERPGTWLTGRCDTTGNPSVLLNGGMVKILVVLWDGDKGINNALGRIYTPWWWEQ